MVILGFCTFEPINIIGLVLRCLKSGLGGEVLFGLGTQNLEMLFPRILQCHCVAE